ncbi:P-loop containing nucleoside triphosphate hydrolase protein [Rhizoclosmatium globosum]|uniref:p-loop containing nucleoside triphosphate hydrolase protein n=1 Tax=Rhizoclosmatium globosum TaxID=329046 RepID=A0A1Y2C1I3_9FUNG|nr:P-loop containing nucleoside triphosphate hydrolase protein [Rhizoclosmatium globosum]|eukprot:ORY40165.1 P-loop containing nucleoside triphosphate hydrolase protein [Rhizoclosmatium globosum]
MEAGEIVQFGEFVELMGDEKGRLVQIMKDYHLDEEEGLENVVVAKKKGKVEDETREQEVVAEDRQTGLVTTETYAWYFRLFGFNRLGLLMCLFVMMVGFKVSSGITLSLTFATSVIGVCGNALTLYSTIPTSRRIHNNAMGGLLRAKMSFYDTNRLGKSYRELKRLSSIMQSPNIAHISETLSGIPTVLAYNGQPQFIAKQMARQDQANLSMLLFSHSQYWINLRLDALGALITLSLVLFGVGGILPRSFVGLALSLVGASAVALNGYPAEASRDLPKDAHSPMASSGSIDIKNLELCYDARPDHKVINGITLHISAGEKIGVVGRTGSGKSTLMDSFFRLIEAQAGSITIDGQDISTLGLRKTRLCLTALPIKYRSFSKYTDEDIWYALECVGMKEYVSSLNEKLDSAISEGGTNLSAGQRQLLCLAKVLLEKSKILIMDEATSSDATVLSVAHRLNTIAAFDKVLVLENGKVAEFEPPHLLLSREGTIFGEMVNATGSANAAVIGEIARDHYDLIRH